MENNNFSEFDEVILSYFYLSEDICIPLRVDIADIDFSENKERQLKLKFENKQVTLYKTDSPFDYSKYYLIKEIEKIVKHIDVKSELFEYKNLLEFLELKNTKELAIYIIDYLKVPVFKIVELKEEICGYKELLKANFMAKLKEYMLLNENPKDFSPDYHGVDSKNFDMKISQTYIKAQNLIEYHNSTPFFKENINKAYQEWSWREIQLRLMYLNRKNQIDTEQNRLQDAIHKAIEKQGAN